jgi:Flp pilus assembly protein TadD
MFTKQQRRTGFICLVLVLGTALLYWPVADFDFISLDDTVYVVNNFHINGGLNWHELAWCFQAGHAGNWHPLTWISHALDCQLFGVRPGWHHAANVAIHAANSVLLFLILRRMTGAFWRSSVVAALFAWHPLHVESVAWIAERKDVLSTLFWMLTLWAYVRYTENLKSQISNSKFHYIAALLLFALGLMSKPMLVTLPFVLLLLDWWPLNRLRLDIPEGIKTGSRLGRAAARPYRIGPGRDDLPVVQASSKDFPPGTESTVSLIVEKIPFILLAIPCAVLTLVAQHRGDAVASLSDLPFRLRMINAVVSYLRYLEKIIWPVDLSILYPFTVRWPAWEIVLAVVTLAAITALFVWGARPSRSQPSASRRRNASPYLLVGWLWFVGTLVPVIGLVQVGTQAMADRYAYIPSIGIFIVFCWGAYDLVKNLPYHRGFLSVFSIAILTGCVLVSSRQIQFWKNSGTLFSHAIEVTRDNFVARVNYADYLGDTQQWAAARRQAEEAVRLEPNDAITHSALGRVLVLEGKPDQAVVELRRAISLRFVPSDAVQLALALAQQGRTKDAIAEYRTILSSNPDLPDALNNLAWILATSPHSEFRNGPEAVQLASRACALTHDSQPLMIGTLAAACAEAGRFDDAVITAQKAHDVAAAQGKKDVAARNLELLQLYRSHRAYVEEK